LKNYKLKKLFQKRTVSERLYELPCPVIGLTGGIATGKTTVADELIGRGFPIINADKLVKNIYQTKDALEFISHHFPEVIINQAIDFKRLREIVFSNQKDLELIENFIYQKLPAEFLKAFVSLPAPDFVIYDVPLLFEKQLDSKVDLKVCVYTSEKNQIERLMKRDQSELSTIKQILKKQIDIEWKKNHSDFIIDNSSDLTSLMSNIDHFIQKYFEEV